MCIINILKHYIPQIIGIIGTILGAIIGWFLNYMSNHLGKIDVEVNNFRDKLNKSNQYGYIFKLFLYNTSAKPQYIRDLQVVFCDKYNCELLKSKPCIGKYTFNTLCDVMEAKKGQSSVIYINGYAPYEIELADFINKDSYKCLKHSDRIFLLYKDHRKKIKKVYLRKSFDIDSVSKFDQLKFS